jgi:hypothetical protein
MRSALQSELASTMPTASPIVPTLHDEANASSRHRWSARRLLRMERSSRTDAFGPPVSGERGSRRRRSHVRVPSRMNRKSGEGREAVLRGTRARELKASAPDRACPSLHPLRRDDVRLPCSKRPRDAEPLGRHRARHGAGRRARRRPSPRGRPAPVDVWVARSARARKQA